MKYGSAILGGLLSIVVNNLVPIEAVKEILNSVITSLTEIAVEFADNHLGIENTNPNEEFTDVGLSGAFTETLALE